MIAKPVRSRLLVTALLIQNLINRRYTVIATEEIIGAPKAFFKEKSIVNFALIKTKIKEKDMIKKAIEMP